MYNYNTDKTNISKKALVHPSQSIILRIIFPQHVFFTKPNHALSIADFGRNISFI